MDGSFDDIRWGARDAGTADKRRPNKGVAPIMKIRNFIPPVLLTAVSAAAIAVAPLADAALSCMSTGTASVCESAGNAQVSATPPPVDYQAQYPFFGGVLIFHHGGRH